MPYYYDITTIGSTGSTASLTENTGTLLFGKCGANTETVSVIGLFAACQEGTLGGGSIRLKDNTAGSSAAGVASGGGAVTPVRKNQRGSVAAASTWQGDSTTAITAGTILRTRLSVGFAQTGGMGGYVPIVPQAAVQLMPNSSVNFNPTDLEFTTITFSTSMIFDWTLEFGEGV